MKIYCLLISAFLFLILLQATALASPVITDIFPSNGSYIKGTNTDVFGALKITDSNLNLTSIYLHIRVEDPTSVWSNISMSTNCYNTILTEWSCNTTVPGMNALAKDGNYFLYYFDASSNDGSYGSNGTAAAPNKVRIDRRGPSINFTKPVNQGYIGGGNVTIKMNIVDEISGVNSTTVGYSFDNSSWLTTSQSSDIFSSVQTWDTTAYSNNQTISIFAKASDFLGNENYTYINTTIDNEMPRLYILTPAANQTLYGTVLFSFAAEDTYSGLNNNTAILSLGSYSNKLNCNGSLNNYNCSLNLTTSSVADSPYNLTYSIEDNGGNLAQNTTPIIIDNLPPVISISSPADSSEVSGNVTLNAAITDAGTGVINETYRWENTTNLGSWTSLSCAGSARSLSCSAIWNSADFMEGIYTLRVQAYDNLSRQTLNGVTVHVVKSLGTTTTLSSSGANPSSASSTSSTISSSQNTTTTTGASGSLTPFVIYLTEVVSNNWWIIVAIVLIVIVVVLTYLFWHVKSGVYPGYKPK